MNSNTHNDGCEYREQLGANAHGQTLLAYLTLHYTHSSAADWSARIESGHVRVDDLPARCDDVLRRGSTLVWQRPPWVEPDAPRDISILYEDDDLLAVAKPAGLPTLPGANFLQATLLHRVQAIAPNAVPVHRLGRWTSGVVLCARTPQARSHLMKQWTDKNVAKRYRALVGGLPEWNEITIDTPIGPVPHALLGSLYAASAYGKNARSQVLVLERREDCCLCDVTIETGRPHQIRIHLAAVGYPLLGDPLFIAGGVPAPNSHAVPGDPGYQLHATELGFLHPTTGQAMLVVAEPPLLLQIGT